MLIRAKAAMAAKKAGVVKRQPNFTVEELRAMHARLSTLAHNPYDVHHDHVRSAIAKLDAFLGGR